MRCIARALVAITAFASVARAEPDPTTDAKPADPAPAPAPVTDAKPAEPEPAPEAKSTEPFDPLEPTTPPAPTSHRRRNIAIAGGVSLGVSAALIVLFALEGGPINDYRELINDGNPENNPHFEDGHPYQSQHCDLDATGPGSVDFYAACRAKRRQTYTLYTMGGLALVGAGLVIAAAVMHDPAPPVAIAPIITPDGACATLQLTW